jgi:cell division protein ZapA (FtsZ GTPase activity inhibitor)
MSTPNIEVTIGRLKVKVPPAGSRENTLRVAEIVNDRISALQARTGAIDSYDLALMAAMSFAAELDQTTREHATKARESEDSEMRESKELFVALKKISDSLRKLLREMGKK